MRAFYVIIVFCTGVDNLGSNLTFSEDYYENQSSYSVGS